MVVRSQRVEVLGRGTRRVVNRAATALRQAANTLMRSRSYLGAQYRRLRTKLGAPKAITAMAHRLARLVYRMLRYGQAYVDKGTEYYEERFRQQTSPACLTKNRIDTGRGNPGLRDGNRKHGSATKSITIVVCWICVDALSGERRSSR